MACGYEPRLFWELTPRELSLMFDAAVEENRKEHNERAWSVWHVAALTRMDPKKFPKLESLLDTGPKQPQTPDQMESILRALNAALGGDDLTKKVAK